MEKILTPAAGVEIKYRVEDSKFLAALAGTNSVQEAREFVAGRKEKYHDATHNVSAFIIGTGDEARKYSDDDGEPANSSGPPVLQAIEGAGLTNTVIVVTRYFGGTKLGIGGLIRAYGGAARKAIKAAEIEELKPVWSMVATGDYDVLGSVLGQIESAGGKIEDVTYDDSGGKVKFLISPEDTELIRNKLISVTANNVEIRKDKLVYWK